MPNGFFGNAARSYMTRVTDARKDANDAAQQSQDTVPPGTPGAALRERRLPFGPGDGTSGRYSIGHGNSSNIVVSQSQYDEIAWSIGKIDDAMGECIYKTAMEIEEMCETIFVMPDATEQCKNISQTVKGMLDHYVGLTEDIRMQARNFAREIVEAE